MRWLVCGVLLVAGLGMTGNSQAGTLQEDYKSMEARRRGLEKIRGGYEERLDGLTHHLETVLADLNACIDETVSRTRAKTSSTMGGNLQVLWEMRLEEAELVRRASEDDRRRLQKLWKELGEVRRQFEEIREEIERTYRKNRGKAYEEAFREYMRELEKQYFLRIENDLFSAYEGYLSAVEGYTEFLENSLMLCRRTGPSS